MVVVFLVSLCHFLFLVNTFAVNYYGRPFMKDVHENKLFYRNIQMYYLLLIACALEIFPPLNDLMQLTTLPTTRYSFQKLSSHGEWKSQLYLNSIIEVLTFPGFITIIMILDTMLSFGFERTIRRVYATKQVSK